jgi:hypothetical protein
MLQNVRTGTVTLVERRTECTASLGWGAGSGDMTEGSSLASPNRGLCSENIILSKVPVSDFIGSQVGTLVIADRGSGAYRRQSSLTAYRLDRGPGTKTA